MSSMIITPQFGQDLMNQQLLDHAQRNDYEMMFGQDCFCECHFVKRNKLFRCSVCGCEQEAEYTQKSRERQ